MDNTSPTVRIVGIESGATLPRGQVALNVESEDNTGIKSISYFVGGELVGTAEATPYQVIWGAAPGDSTVIAVAIDRAGNRTESEAVEFRVP